MIVFEKFYVRRFRTLLNLTLNFRSDSITAITGENNIGKTNFLRALDVYFNHSSNNKLFMPEKDLPYHIYFGSRGQGAETDLVGTFRNSVTNQSTEIKLKLHQNHTHKFYIDDVEKPENEARTILGHFKYFFIEASNVNVPALISTMLENDGLLPLDKKRSKQSKPLVKLEEFIQLSQSAISDLEKDLNTHFQNLTNFDGILKGKEIRIKFAEFEKLRDIVKTMTSLTLYDGNDHEIESKGSGAQRAVFLSLMQFISRNEKSKKVIWGIDEPEAFITP